jgi:hypothetical protein
MSIALDLRAGTHAIDGASQLLAWVRTLDARSVHVTLRGSIREPRQRQLQRTLLGMGCKVTMMN